MPRTSAAEPLVVPMPPMTGGVAIPVDSLVPDPKQPRSQFEPGASDVRTEVQDLDQMAESMRLLGVVQALLVRPNDDGETFTIVAGERRWRAAKIAGLATVPCVITEDTDPARLAGKQLVENVHRKSLTALEVATALENLASQYEMSGKDLASFLGLSPTWISRHRALLKAEGPAKQALDDGWLKSADIYYHYAKLNERDQMRLLKQARKNKTAISQSDVETALAQAQGRTPPVSPSVGGPASPKQPDMVYLPCLTRAQCERLFQRLRLPAPSADPDQISAAFLEALGDTTN